MRLYFYAVCHLLQLASDDVPYLIVAKRRETTGGARESMLNREGGTTDTSRSPSREPCRVPAIPQCQTIAKFTLRQAEPMPIEGATREPAGCTRLTAKVDGVLESRGGSGGELPKGFRGSCLHLRLEAFRLATSAKESPRLKLWVRTRDVGNHRSSDGTRGLVP